METDQREKQFGRQGPPSRGQMLDVHPPQSVVTTAFVKLRWNTPEPGAVSSHRPAPALVSGTPTSTFSAPGKRQSLEHSDHPTPK